MILRKVLNRICKSGLRLNKSKHVFSAAEKSFHIKDVPIPENKSQLPWCFGTIHFIGKIIPNLSQVRQPLRILLEKEVECLIDNLQLETRQQDL